MKVGMISTPSGAYLYQKAKPFPRAVGLISPMRALQALLIIDPALPARSGPTERSRSPQALGRAASRTALPPFQLWGLSVAMQDIALSSVRREFPRSPRGGHPMSA